MKEKYRARFRQHGITEIFFVKAENKEQAKDLAIDFYEANSHTFQRHSKTNYELNVTGPRKGGKLLFQNI